MLLHSKQHQHDRKCNKSFIALIQGRTYVFLLFFMFFSFLFFSFSSVSFQTWSHISSDQSNRSFTKNVQLNHRRWCFALKCRVVLIGFLLLRAFVKLETTDNDFLKKTLKNLVILFEKKKSFRKRQIGERNSIGFSLEPRKKRSSDYIDFNFQWFEIKNFQTHLHEKTFNGKKQEASSIIIRLFASFFCWTRYL